VETQLHLFLLSVVVLVLGAVFRLPLLWQDMFFTAFNASEVTCRKRCWPQNYIRHPNYNSHEIL